MEKTFLIERRRDLERLRRALHAGDLRAIREVGQNLQVYGLEELSALGEELRCAAEECSTLRIVHLQGRLAAYLSQARAQDDGVAD